MKQNLITIIKDSGLDKQKSQVMLDNFQDYFKVAAEWEKKAKTLKVTSESQTADMEMARTGRLFLMRKRTTLDRVRKELKEQSMREGRAIDGIANVLKALIIPIENYLGDQENFVVRKEQARAEVLRIEDAERSERERIAKEKADAAEQERIRKENEQLREANRKNEEKLLREKKKTAAEKRKKEEAIENERKEAQRKQQEADARAKREKDVAVQVEKKKREKVEAELREKEEKEEKERRTEEERIEKDKRSSDKVKLTKVANYVNSMIPEVKSERAKRLLERASFSLDCF